MSYRLRGHGPDPGPTPYDFERHVDDLGQVIDDLTPAVVGGISLGAHIVATWAATVSPPPWMRGLALALPAWMGEPDSIAAANTNQAREIERMGVAACLGRLAADLAGSDAAWVSEEMAATWREHDETAFCAVLDAVAISHAPSADQLARIVLPIGISAVVDDPLHPSAIAHQWSAATPSAVVTELTIAACGADRSLIGESAMAALDASESR